MGERRMRTKGERVPRHGHAFVTVTARDANGFLHHFDEIEAPVGALHEALAILQLKSTAMEAAHRDAHSA
ncbi:hypothetical protein F6B41_12180 [Microbacterium lushaniae]|nr:hypothetical protein F6B41_12180 [Microbacterium lushaniae]